MTLRLLIGLGSGVFLIVLLYFGGSELLYPSFLTSRHVNRAEREALEEIREFAEQERISAEDEEKILKWTEQENLRRLMISRGKRVLFDSMYGGKAAPGIQSVARADPQPEFAVSFADGDAQVYVDTGFSDSFYHVCLGISLAAGLAACLWIFVSGTHEDIRYIQRLQQEVSVISRGDLTGNVTIRGEDELADLARGLDRMRVHLMEKEQKEKEMRLAQEKLVLGMSHDLRTPLTALMTYLEIIRQQVQEGRVDEQFLDKMSGQVRQIRDLADGMFEYFYVTSSGTLQTAEEAEDLFSACGDYLSELCFLLEHDGFSVDARGLEFRPVRVRIHMEYIGRIFNNLISNLKKYADKSEAIRLDLFYSGERAGIRIRNKILASGREGKGSGIGVQNITLMIEQMGGSAEADMEDGHYTMILYFRITR